MMIDIDFFQTSFAKESDDNYQLLLSSFLDSNAIKLWQDCCIAAKECCQKMIMAKNDTSVGRLTDNDFSEVESTPCKKEQGKN